MRFEGDQRNIGPELREQRVLITGANGFIGANLVRRLLAIGAKPHAFVRPSADLHALAEVEDKIVIHRGSVEDTGSVAEVIRRSAPALIAHLATARGKSTNSAQFVRTSVIGAINVIEGMRQSPGARLIVAGSSLEYAPSDGSIPESWPWTNDPSRGGEGRGGHALWACGNHRPAHNPAPPISCLWPMGICTSLPSDRN